MASLHCSRPCNELTTICLTDNSLTDKLNRPLPQGG